MFSITETQRKRLSLDFESLPWVDSAYCFGVCVVLHTYVEFRAEGISADLTTMYFLGLTDPFCETGLRWDSLSCRF